MSFNYSGFRQGKVAPIPDPKKLSLLYRTKKYSVTLYKIEVISRKLLVQRGAFYGKRVGD